MTDFNDFSAFFWAIGALLIVGGVVGGWLHVMALTIQAIRDLKSGGGDGSDDDLWSGGTG